MRRTATLVLATATAALLTACTGGDTPPGPSATVPATSPAADTGATLAATPDAPLAPATAECLQGTWQVDLDALRADLLRSVGGADAGVEIAVSGTTTYEFGAPDGLVVTVDSTSSVTLADEGSSLESTSVAAGTLRGTWTLDGTTLVVSDVDAAGLDVTTTASLDGDDVETPDSPDDAIGAMPPTTSTASCGPDRAELVATLQQDEDSEPVTVTTTLRR